jgi:hypothetical protein
MAVDDDRQRLWLLGFSGPRPEALAPCSFLLVRTRSLPLHSARISAASSLALLEEWVMSLADQEKERLPLLVNRLGLDEVCRSAVL